MDYKFFGLQMCRDKHSVKPRLEQNFWKLLEQKKSVAEDWASKCFWKLQWLLNKLASSSLIHCNIMITCEIQGSLSTGVLLVVKVTHGSCRDLQKLCVLRKLGQNRIKISLYTSQARLDLYCFQYRRFPKCTDAPLSSISYHFPWDTELDSRSSFQN